MNHTYWYKIGLVVAGPLFLAILELFHPHPHDLLMVPVQTWMAIHYAQILLFPLAALSVTMLVRGRRDVAAGICRVAMFLFAVSYVAFDTAAGVATGILVKAAHNSGNPEAWRGALDAIWRHPIMGGAAMSPPPFLAVSGSVALSVGAVTGGISLKRAGSSWPLVVLLAVSSFGIAVFKTHAWLGGPLTFGGIAIAAGWLMWEKNRNPRVPA